MQARQTRARKSWRPESGPTGPRTPADFEDRALETALLGLLPSLEFLRTQLEKALAETIADPGVRKGFAEQGVEASFVDSAKAAAQLEAESLEQRADLESLAEPADVRRRCGRNGRAAHGPSAASRRITSEASSRASAARMISCSCSLASTAVSLKL